MPIDDVRLLRGGQFWTAGAPLDLVFEAVVDVTEEASLNAPFSQRRWMGVTVTCCTRFRWSALWTSSSAGTRPSAARDDPSCGSGRATTFHHCRPRRAQPIMGMTCSTQIMSNHDEEPR